jgi:hypothetical protein
MLTNSKAIALMSGACLVLGISSSNAQVTEVTQKFDKFKSASQDLLNLYQANADRPDDKTIKADIDAITKQRDAAAMALGNVLEQTLKTADPSNRQEAILLEPVFDEIQTLNKAVTDAEVRYDESRAIADEEAASNSTNN